MRYLITGLIFAIFNEVYFHPMWDYSPKLKPFIFADVPLIAIIGWPLIFFGIFKLSDFITKKARLKVVLCDLTLIVSIFAPAEYILSRAGIWKYNYWLHENVVGMIIGYLLTGYIVHCMARR